MDVDWTDSNLWFSLATIVFNPTFWNVVSFFFIKKEKKILKNSLLAISMKNDFCLKT